MGFFSLTITFIALLKFFLKLNYVKYFSFCIFQNYTIFTDFVILVDTYSLIFGCTVSIICFSVFNFSKSYITEEKFKIRFRLLLLMFVFSIFILIFSANLLTLIIGWDGLGVVSYLLVIYFFSRKSNNAGILTILRNRIGDILLIIIIRIVVIRNNWRWWGWINISISNYVCLFLCLGCFTKRAQIPFSAWLPAAIAAPTPVSSLVHSSTLVTAGVYLIFRFRGLLNWKFVEYFGIITILIAGLNALKEIDIKKIVALSTLRQLGLIICRIGMGFFLNRFYHLILHAFFKALLFINVGNIIHYSDDFQDLRKINFFENFSSLTLSFCLIANFRLIGFPFLRGFFSKDLILERFFLDNFIRNSYWIGFWIGCVLTSIYRSRFIYEIIFSFHKRKSLIWKFLEDWNFIWGRLILTKFSLFIGSRVFWVLSDFKEILIFPYSFKFIINFILIRGIFAWSLIFYWTKSFTFNRWRIYYIWSLPNFRKYFLKKVFLKWNHHLRFKLDQFLNKEILIFVDQNLRFFKKFNLKKYFLLWKLLILIALIIII